MNAEQSVALTAEVERASNDVSRIAQSIVVVDQGTYEDAGQFLKDVKLQIHKFGVIFDGIVKKTHQAWQQALADRNQFIHPLEAAEKHVKGVMGAWWRKEQDRIAAERRAAEAEKARIEAENRKKAADDALKRAEELQAAGDIGGALETIAEPVQVRPADVEIPKVAPPKVTGIGMKRSWDAEVVDLMAVVKAVAAGEAPLDFLSPVHSKINQAVRAAEGRPPCAGLRITETTNVSSRMI